MGNNNLDETSGDAPETPKKSAGFQLSQDPMIFGAEEVEAHKFEIAPEPVTAPPSTEPAPEYEHLGELPASYAEDTLYLVARDPRWLFSYWDFDWTRFPGATMRGGVAQFFLKLTTETGATECVVEIKPEARNWYVPVSQPDSGYFAEIGYYDAAGGWQSIVKSALAMTPSEALASEIETDFATLPVHLTFERMLDLLKERMEDGESLIAALARVANEGEVQFRGGQTPTWSEDQKRLLAALLGNTLIDQLGLGSEEIDQLLRKQIHEKFSTEVGSLPLAASLFAPGPHSLYSGIGASWSAQPFSLLRERGFFMHVNAEIIFYGGTDPDATVWIDGKEIKLSPDGTFRYHFTLPDGDFAIPIVAQSPDKVEQRSATLSFVRGTAKMGQVDDTGQPAELAPLIGQQ